MTRRKCDAALVGAVCVTNTSHVVRAENNYKLLKLMVVIKIIIL